MGIVQDLCSVYAEKKKLGKEGMKETNSEERIKRGHK